MKKLIVITLVFLASFLFSVGAVKADTDRPQKIVTLSSDEVIDEDYFAAGDTVEIFGTVNGDVYVGGGEVLVDGIINGDLLVGGGNITISGEVSQDIRAGGGQITINGMVGGNVTVVGGNIIITDSADIKGSLVAGAGNVSLTGSVGKNVKAGVGNFSLSGPVAGNVEIGAETIRLSSNAQVGGDFTYWSQTDASVDKNATVGSITKKAPPEGFQTPEEAEKIKTEFLQGALGARAGIKLIGFLSFLVVGLLLSRLFPNCSIKTADILNSKPGPSLLLGLTALIVTPIAFLFLLVTIVGIPLAFLTLSVYFIFLYVAKYFVMVWVGTKVLKEKVDKPPYKTFVIGLAIYTLVTLIPFVGGLTQLLALLFGLGASLLSLKSSFAKAKKAKVI